MRRQDQGHAMSHNTYNDRQTVFASDSVKSVAYYGMGFDNIGPRQLLSVYEIAYRLGMSKASFYRFRCRNPLPGHIRRGHYRGSDILEWFDAINAPQAKDGQPPKPVQNNRNVLSLDAMREKLQRG